MTGLLAHCGGDGGLTLLHLRRDELLQQPPELLPGGENPRGERLLPVEGGQQGRDAGQVGRGGEGEELEGGVQGAGPRRPGVPGAGQVSAHPHQVLGSAVTP